MGENGHSPVTSVIAGSELRGVARAIWHARGGTETVAEYEKKLKVYLRDLGKREEAIHTTPGFMGIGKGTTATGFFFTKFGQEVFVPRPESPKIKVYGHSDYSPGPYGGRASTYGLLSRSTVNREIRHQRVADYAYAMQRGEWRDLLSDPITVTHDGEIVNGQHRLAAANQVDWDKAPNDPKFLVVWGVSAAEALHADLARRTNKDQATIFSKLVTAA